MNKRYGDQERIVTTYVEKFFSWSNLKAVDVDGFDQFSVMLMSCKNAITGVSQGAREIEHPKTEENS